jgi:hypothetical protein
VSTSSDVHTFDVMEPCDKQTIVAS